MNDPMTILKKDHREVKTMLTELKETRNTSHRQRQLAEVERALLLHMQIEESIVYPMLAETGMEEQAIEAEVEHQLVRDGLNQAKQLEGEPGFGAVIDMLLGGITHHVKEEESEVLPALKEQLTKEQWRDMGDQIMAMKGSDGQNGTYRRSSAAVSGQRPRQRSASSNGSRTAATTGSRR